MRFHVFTDHNALIYMVRAQIATNDGRLMRYLMDIYPALRVPVVPQEGEYAPGCGCSESTVKDRRDPQAPVG